MKNIIPQRGLAILVQLLLIHKWKIFSLIAFIGITYAGIYAIYPKSTIVMGMQTRNLDEATGEPKKTYKEYYELKDYLAQKGVELKFTTQKEIGRHEKEEKSNLDFLIEGKTTADFVLAENTGAKISEDIKAKFSTLGAVQYKPILLYKRKNDGRIQYAKDLIGKKIILWSSPEGNAKAIESYLGQQASPYSNDYVIQEVFRSFGITSSNTKIINAWPNKISLDTDWDVWIALSLPRKESAVSSEMFDALEAGNIEFLELNNVLGLSRNLRYLKPLVIPASTFSIERNFPPKDIHTLAINTDIIVKNELDSGLVMTLAEAVQSVFSAPNKLWEKNELPNFSQYSQFDPSEIAKDYYRNGAPFLKKYLPLNLSTLVTKLIIIFLPVITILWPLFHFIPQIYGFFVKRRISRWYKELEMVEKNYFNANKTDKKEFLHSIAEIEQGIRDLKIPFLHDEYIQELFDARMHIELIKQKIGVI